MVFLGRFLSQRLQRPKEMDKKSIFRFLRPSEKNNVISGAVIISGICVAIGWAIVYPMLTIDEWKKIQAINRKDIDQEAVQPGDMRVWSDPFTPRTSK